ncbi:hypothetical protein FHETE_8262 [Fusarium heterosporum]|uniref:Uncharacterized protein n=1 Tax=Fusarium heterosporum TaxID=42747 RepID=A0A8H5SZF0_FUSHE|nr:hypothetical protein FHETE_8262 [Fusarium heterosporum]
MPAATPDHALIVFDGLLGPPNLAQLYEVSGNRYGANRIENSELVTEAAVAGLSIISSKYSFSLGERDLLRLTAITDPQDPWTTAIAAATASKLLTDQLTSQELTDFITSAVLQKLLKPLFMKSSARVTTSGRPSQYVNVEDGFWPPSEAQTWKTQVPWVEATIGWAVNTSSTRLIQDHWPLFMPVLLALVEHNPIEVKTRGLKILKLFVGKCPDRVLQNTGIGRVFADVTFPLLLYLPNVTPEDQSIDILAPAYDVLVELAESTGRPGNTERRKLLDKLLRDGILAGYFHASHHARIMEVLMQKTAAIVDCLGIYSTKHLKTLWIQNASNRPPKLDEVLEQEPRLAKLFTPAST